MAGLRQALVLVLTMAVTADSTLKVPWNTDPERSYIKQNGPIGPDGPWQAPLLTSKLNDFPLLPSLFYVVTLPDKSIGGLYDPKSTPAKPINDRGLESSEMASADFYKLDSNVTPYSDTMEIVGNRDVEVNINVTVFDATKWNIFLPNNKQYTPKLGFMGLADNDKNSPSSAKTPPGILEQLKSNKTIGSRSFSMHLGSAKLKQSGSFVLGGYDQSRALGDVGRWDFNGALGLYLKDVTLGVEQGGSPFASANITKDSPASLWQGLGGSEVGRNNTRLSGGPDGSALTAPLTSFSSIYLPKGNCEGIAQHLPVTWRKDIGYYVWNTKDEQYNKIVSSPAYLGFVFATPDTKDITIKVPFGLLNLTLESPIVDSPTPYFPCKSYNGMAGVWPLGLAFLQAAFMHVDFEKGAIYLAQGPGPTLEQSLIQSFNPGDSIKTNPISSFAKTWQDHWTVLAEDGKSEDKTPKKGLAPGAIAGIVVGVVVVLAAVAVLLWFLRRRKIKAAEMQANAVTSEQKQTGSQIGERSGAGELQGSGGIHEAPGTYLSHEVQGETPSVRYEMPDQSSPLELYGDQPTTQVPPRKPVQS